jgi:hypothetical protein
MALKDVLAAALRDSETTGKEREFRLSRGLVVSVRSTATYTRLRLRRNESKPSPVEWRTVIGSFPYPCEGVEPRETVENGHVVLCASWPTPVRLLDV